MWRSSRFERKKQHCLAMQEDFKPNMNLAKHRKDERANTGVPVKTSLKRCWSYFKKPYQKSYQNYVSSQPLFTNILMLRIILLPLLIHFASPYKILIYAPHLSRSHVIFMSTIADVLADAGHEVTVYSLEFMPNVTAPNPREAKVITKSLSFEIDYDILGFMSEMWDKQQISVFAVIKIMRFMGNYLSRLCECRTNKYYIFYGRRGTALEDTVTIEQFRKEKFDLGISEHIDPCGLAYFEKINVEKYISADSLCLNEDVTIPLGIDSNPSFVPNNIFENTFLNICYFSSSKDVVEVLYNPFSDEMSYWERVQNFLRSVSSALIRHIAVDLVFSGVFRKHLRDDFDIICTTAYKKLDQLVVLISSDQLQEKFRNSVFAMVNSDEYLDFPRPVTHKIIYIGGIGAKKSEPLSSDYQNLLDSATEGVVYVSFGSILRSEGMPTETKKAFVSFFQNFPQQIVYVITFLAHQNLKAFITHGGLNSITESAHSGVPIIVIPMFGDQLRNARMVEKRGIARIVDKRNITEGSLTEALEEILKNDRYNKAAKRLQQLILQKPFSATERLIKYTEHAVVFGHIDNLDLASTKLNFFQYYLLDIIVPLIVLTTIFLRYFVALSLYKIKSE
ncbi:unnamed protein product [Enterobius vermicularis]|uniref:glucuronosyltransferase n=1 Tax=Enterobius vermicularis TaxID=51028 RepID=A0A0N4VF40_ENTVE|nr:unnamed protein product [Enterobius vermicularis]